MTYEEFSKIELRVARILEAEKVEGSEKLVKLKISLGFKQEGEISVEETKQIVAGIGKVYRSEILIGKQIVVVNNLEPRSFMGLESQGMLLAASGADGPALLIPDKEVLIGAPIK